MVEELQVAGVDGEGLVRVVADQITVADVVGPGGAAVGLAGEGLVLGASLHSPLAIEAAGGEGTEVAAGGPDGLDDHQVLVLAVDLVDLDSLEQVVRSVLQDDLGLGAEVAGEVVNGHAGAVDAAIVASEEEIHVGVIADDGLVDDARAGVGDGTREERLRLGPAVGVGGIAGRLIREGRRAPLVGQDPDVLGREVEDGWGNGTRAHGVLRRRGHVRPVGEGAKGHRPVVAGGIGSGGVHDMLAVGHDVGEVLERGPS